MSEQRYELVRLGGTGDWVQQSLEKDGLMICPICYQNEKEMPLMASNNRSFLCQHCSAMFYTDPPDDQRRNPVN